MTAGLQLLSSATPLLPRAAHACDTSALQRREAHALAMLERAGLRSPPRTTPSSAPSGRAAPAAPACRVAGEAAALLLAALAALGAAISRSRLRALVPLDERTSRLDETSSGRLAELLVQLTRTRRVSVLCATDDPLIVERADAQLVLG